jgi:magnesium chelatase family protein
MTATTWAISFSGLKPELISVQAHLNNGLQVFNIVGLADKAIAESKERIRAAFSSIGLSLPTRRITINLAPAAIHKEGSHFDLPIALALLGAAEIIPPFELENYISIGELSLDAKINPVQGVLPSAIFANENEKTLICPAANQREAAWSGSAPFIATDNLMQLINFLNEKQFPPINQYLESKAPSATISYPKFEEVKGQEATKRALEIAAAGGHNVLMIGSPGSGKSMLAQRLPGIMPPLTSREILETSIINSIAGRLDEQGIQTQRPFRAPHSSSSLAAIVGGGRNAKPGEVTLAHNGILFLDELPEFSRNTLEALRQPVEERVITVARANAHITYPANFLLIAAMNPCRCGYYGDVSAACSKAPRCAEDYQSRISGPLYDRFDLQVEVFPIDFRQYHQPSSTDITTTESIRERVISARQLQFQRYNSEEILNSNVSGELLEQITAIDGELIPILEKAMLKFKMSMRAYTKLLRVARTIADLEQAETISKDHIFEALSFRLAKLRS